jgi:hypothetical protein
VEIFLETCSNRDKGQRSLFRTDFARLEQDINFAAGLADEGFIVD